MLDQELDIEIIEEVLELWANRILDLKRST